MSKTKDTAPAGEPLTAANVAALDRIAGNKPTDPHAHIIEQLGRHRPAGQLTFVTPSAKFGVTNEVGAELRAIVSQAPAFPAAEKRIQEIDKQQRTIYAAMVKEASVPAPQRHQAHLDELATRVLDGRGQSSTDGWGVDEFEAERQAQISASKRALHKLTLELHATALPFMQAAVATADTLLHEQIASEGQRRARFGIPFTEPDEVMRSIFAAKQLFTLRVENPPVVFCAAADIVRGLFILN